MRTTRRLVLVLAAASIALTGCPRGSKPYEGAPNLTTQECQDAGGELIGDRGDGNTRRDGCPDGRKFLGFVQLGIEGGICCAR